MRIVSLPVDWGIHLVSAMRSSILHLSLSEVSMFDFSRQSHDRALMYGKKGSTPEVMAGSSKAKNPEFRIYKDAH